MFYGFNDAFSRLLERRRRFEIVSKSLGTLAFLSYSFLCLLLIILPCDNKFYTSESLAAAFLLTIASMFSSATLILGVNTKKPALLLPHLLTEIIWLLTGIVLIILAANWMLSSRANVVINSDPSYWVGDQVTKLYCISALILFVPAIPCHLFSIGLIHRCFTYYIKLEHQRGASDVLSDRTLITLEGRSTNVNSPNDTNSAPIVESFQQQRF